MKKIIKAKPKELSLIVDKPVQYEKDFCLWITQQANLLKKRNFNELDIQNLVEEIESLGKSDKHSLYSHLVIILLHLLKQKYQPDGQGNSKSWNSSIVNSQHKIKRLIDDSPSLKNELKKIFHDSYEDAREEASVETGLNIAIFPKKCEWKIEEILPFINGVME